MMAAEAERLNVGDVVFRNRNRADRGVVLGFRNGEVCIQWDSTPGVDWYRFEKPSEATAEEGEQEEDDGLSDARE